MPSQSDQSSRSHQSSKLLQERVGFCRPLTPPGKYLGKMATRQMSQFERFRRNVLEKI